PAACKQGRQRPAHQQGGGGHGQRPQRTQRQQVAAQSGTGGHGATAQRAHAERERRLRKQGGKRGDGGFGHAGQQGQGHAGGEGDPALQVRLRRPRAPRGRAL